MNIGKNLPGMDGVKGKKSDLKKGAAGAEKEIDAFLEGGGLKKDETLDMQGKLREKKQFGEMMDAIKNKGLQAARDCGSGCSACIC